MDREATVARACELIAEAAAHGANLVVFPESFIPAYPDWVWAIPPGEWEMLDNLYADLVAQSVEIPGPVIEQLCRAARQTRICVAMGMSERETRGSGTTSYNTLVYIDEQGELIGKHRKLVPTGAERLVWDRGDGSLLQVYDTSVGKIGGLLCWENYMPLARYALYAWGMQIHIAATWDRGDAWLATLRHIAREGRVLVIGCGMPLRMSDIPDRYEFKRKYNPNAGEWINHGDSAIVSPQGEFIAGPLRCQEGILYAEVDPAWMRGSHWMLDVAGHYGRPDIFELTVHRAQHPTIKTEDGGAIVLCSVSDK
jgi:nitrilase